jgi:thymidylate synthase
MLWFLSGSQNIAFLLEHDVHIWDEWANQDGDVGPLYGYQWRHWRIDPKLVHLYGGATEIDQMAEVMQTLQERPEARSHMVTAWKPDHLKAMSIKPCHILLQFYRYDDEISLMLTQRSCDAFLGVPFNIAQYSLLTHMVAHQLGCTAKEFTWIGGDVHIYENHVTQIREQLSRPVLEPPRISFARKPPSLFDYRYEDFLVHDYQHGGFLKGNVSLQGTPGQGIRI